MRINVDVSNKLINEVMAVFGENNKEEAIRLALEEVTLMDRRRKIRTCKGKLDLDIDLDHLRGRL